MNKPDNDDLDLSRFMRRNGLAAAGGPRGNTGGAKRPMSNLMLVERVDTPRADHPHHGNGGGAGGGGHNNGGNRGPKEPFFTRKDLRIMMYFGMMLIAIALYILAQRTVLNMTRDSIQSQRPAAVPTLPTAGQQQQQVMNNIITAHPFSCTTVQMVEDGFARAQAVQLSDGQGLRLSSGCTLIQVNKEVSKLEASGGYQFAVEVSGVPGNFYKCGTIGGQNDTVSACKDFLARHMGQNMRVALSSGARVVIQ